MKTWPVVVSVVAVLLAASIGVGVWILNDIKADLTSMRTELNDMRAELNEIKEKIPPTATYTLTVSVSPSGSGTVSPSSGEYESGEQVTMTASPASGYEFDHWGGAASGSSNPTVITMDSDKTVIAYFTRPPDDCEEFPPGLIPWHEANDHIGERVTVCGPVKSTYYCSTCKGEPTFLNIGEPHPNPDRFTVIIWGDNRDNFPETPETYYKDKCVCVTGLVVPYDGIAEIEVTSPDQIEIR